jgi:hypothetical protein
VRHKVFIVEDVGVEAVYLICSVERIQIKSRNVFIKWRGIKSENLIKFLSVVDDSFFLPNLITAIIFK